MQRRQRQNLVAKLLLLLHSQKLHVWVGPVGRCLLISNHQYLGNALGLSVLPNMKGSSVGHSSFTSPDSNMKHVHRIGLMSQGLLYVSTIAVAGPLASKAFRDKAYGVNMAGAETLTCPWQSLTVLAALDSNHEKRLHDKHRQRTQLRAWRLRDIFHGLVRDSTFQSVMLARTLMASVG